MNQVSRRTVRDRRGRDLPLASCLLALAMAVPGCAGGGEGAVNPEIRGTVATLGQSAIPYQAFATFLTDNVGFDTGELDGQNGIMSSLLDQFLEEQVLLDAGTELGIAVSEAEIDAYMKEIGVSNVEDETSAVPVDADLFRAEIRKGLTLQKVKDEAVLSKVQVTDGEVDDYLKKRPEMLRGSRTLVLRQILMEDRVAADRLAQTLAGEPERFEEQARKHSVAPDVGQARTYREEELPNDLLDPLLALDQGQVSRVLELAQRYFIFQMVRRVESAPLDRDEVRDRVRLDLYRQKVDQVLAQYIADLKTKTPIRVDASILPFRYVGEHRH